MKAKHRILAAGMAAAMTLSLAACGGSASTAEPTASSAVETVTPEATSEAASGDVTEVTWWTYFGDKNIGYLQNIIDDFNNSQNQYHVAIVYQGNQMECNAKLQSTEKENLPAMFSGAVEDVAMYANSDFCVPLQKYVDADTEGWQELDDTWDALRSAYSDGQGNLIGYPIGYSYPNIFYNADLLKKAGVDPASIQSFDDLYDASKTIVDGGFATYGIGFFANGAMFNVALGREGVQAYNNENGLNGQPVTECLYDSDTTVHDSIYNMLSIYQKMGAEKLCVPYGADYQSEIIPQMASGDCAMMMGVISMTTKVLDAAAGNFEKITKLCKEARAAALGFEVAHVGVNCEDADAASAVCEKLNEAFDLPVKDGNSSMFASSGIEVMKTMFKGKNGHIAIRTNSVELAVAGLAKKGFAYDESSAKYKNGRMTAAYLKDEFGGFAVHLLQK